MRKYKVKRLFAWILACVITFTNVNIVPVYAAENETIAETILFETDFSDNGVLPTYEMVNKMGGAGWATDDVTGRCLNIKNSSGRIAKTISGILPNNNLTIEMKVKTVNGGTGDIRLNNSASAGSNYLWQGTTGGEWVTLKIELTLGDTITSTSFVDGQVCTEYKGVSFNSTIQDGTTYLIMKNATAGADAEVRFDDIKIYCTPSVEEEEPTDVEEVTIFEQDFEAEGLTDGKSAGFSQNLGTGGIIEVVSNRDNTNKWLHISADTTTKNYGYVEKAIDLKNVVNLTIEADVQTYGDTEARISYKNSDGVQANLWSDDGEIEIADENTAKVKIDFKLDRNGDNVAITYNVTVNGTEIIQNATCTPSEPSKLSIRLGNSGKVQGSGQYYDNIKIYGTRIVDMTNPLLGEQQIAWDRVRPSEDKINADGTLTDASFVKNLTSHPRIFVSSWDDIREKIDSCEETKRWYESVKADADRYLNTPAATRTVNNRGNVLESARGGKRRLVALAFVYGITGESKYLEKAYAEMIEMGQWEDWSEFNSYLVTAELMFGYACAYDWLYDGLDDTQKAELFTIVQNHGLRDLVYNYEGVKTGSSRFTTTTTNWNPLCNTSAIATAFAFADEQPLIMEYILERAPEFIINALEPYQPQGAYPEGTGYWDLGTTWLVYAMNLLDNGFKAEYRLPEKYYYYNTELYPGLADTCDFAIYYSGPAGRFNYGDCGAGTVSTNAFYWMANKFNKPQYTWYEDNLQSSTGEYLFGVDAVAAICFYDAENTAVGEFALDKFYQSQEDVNGISLRSSWENEDALYAVMQGGNNHENHMHYSLGTYVVDHNGKRFVRQHGEYDYSLGGGKDTVYYRRAEASNTLVINPSAEGDQLSKGVATLVASGTSENTAFGILDMSKAYTAGSAEITSAKRGMMLTDNRNRVIIQDEVVLSEEAEFYWFANTDAEITIAEDGKSVLLEMNGERMLVRIIQGPEDAVFGVMDRVSLIEGVVNTIASGTKLFIHVENIQNLNLAVEYVGLEDGEGIPEAREYVPMEQWSVETEQIVDTGFELKVSVDDEEVTYFDVNREEYVLNVDSSSSSIPQISAELISGNASVEVTQAAAVGDSAKVVVTTAEKTYTYIWKIEVDPFTGVEKVNILQGLHVVVEDNPTEAPDYNTFIYVESLDCIDWRGYPERGVVDGIISSESGDKHRWARSGSDSWITFDFGNEYNLHSMGFNGDKQDVRAYDFSVEVRGEDDMTWTKIYEGGAPATTSIMSIIPLGDVEARYVRVTGNGYKQGEKVNTAGFNTWRELRFYESKEQQQEDMVHWPIYFGGSGVFGTVGQTKDLIVQGLNEEGKAFELNKNTVYTCEIADDTIAKVQNGKISFFKAGITDMLIRVEENGYAAEIAVAIVSLEETQEEETPTPTPTPEATETPTASPEVVYLEILTEGTDTSYMPGSAGDIVKIHCTGELQEFVSAELDGQVIEEKNYTLEEGSTIIVFKTDYLETLSVGDHEVTLNYTGDRRIETVLTIYAGVPEADSDSEPEEKTDSTGAVESVEVTPEDSAMVETTPTGDNNNFYVWICLLIISLMSVFSLIVLNKQKSEN